MSCFSVVTGGGGGDADGDADVETNAAIAGTGGGTGGRHSADGRLSFFGGDADRHEGRSDLLGPGTEEQPSSVVNSLVPPEPFLPFPLVFPLSLLPTPLSLTVFELLFSLSFFPEGRFDVDDPTPLLRG